MGQVEREKELDRERPARGRFIKRRDIISEADKVIKMYLYKERHQ